MRSFISVRTAVDTDLPAISAIYNAEVRGSTCTFDTEEQTLAQRGFWLAAHNRRNHPAICAVADGIVIGYASLSPFRAMPAYRSTVEISVYVAEDHRGQGAGRALVTELITRARHDGLTRTVLALITADNEPSLRLHHACGFADTGCLPEAGMKFGRWLDVRILCLRVLQA